MLFDSQFLMIILYTTKTKPYPTKQGRLHEANNTIVNENLLFLHQ